MQIKDITTKGEPLTARPSKIARIIFEEIKGDQSTGEALDQVIKLAALQLQGQGDLSGTAAEALDIWEQSDKLHKKANDLFKG